MGRPDDRSNAWFSGASLGQSWPWIVHHTIPVGSLRQSRERERGRSRDCQICFTAFDNGPLQSWCEQRNFGATMTFPRVNTSGLLFSHGQARVTLKTLIKRSGLSCQNYWKELYSEWLDQFPHNLEMAINWILVGFRWFQNDAGEKHTRHYRSTAIVSGTILWLGELTIWKRSWTFGNVGHWCAS